MVCYDFNNNKINLSAIITEDDNKTVITLSKDNNFEKINYIDFDDFAYAGNTKDDGYLVFPRGTNHVDYNLCIFNKHNDDFVREITESNLPIFGYKNGNTAILGIVSGMKYDYNLVLKLENEKYYIYPRFNIDGDMPYEDLQVIFVKLSNDDANYSGMARKYRDYQIKRGEVVSIKERAKTNKYLDYAINSPMIRIRQAWKPVPSPVPHQTLENEPKMHIACTFKRVCDIIDKLREKNIDKADFCLVGWNVSGHDGRWPEPFPVNEALGGEEELKKLIDYAHKNGYLINCHTNSTDQYEISDMFSWDNLRLLKNGKTVEAEVDWGGGKMYEICPKIYYEQAKEILPKVRESGFYGIHYIDVLAIVHPRKCYNEKHKINTGEAVMYNHKIMKMCHDLFGGFSSEGAYDFAAKYNDYGLYIAFNESNDEIADKSVPLWQLVYHGITLSNPYATTVNYTIKSKKDKLKLIEYGGRPSFYLYSKFVDEGHEKKNWMGNIDLTCDNEEDLEYSANKIKEACDEYEKLKYLQYEFMESHEEISENVFKIKYSDNSVVIVDYNNNTYKVEKLQFNEY